MTFKNPEDAETVLHSQGPHTIDQKRVCLSLQFVVSLHKPSRLHCVYIYMSPESWFSNNILVQVDPKKATKNYQTPPKVKVFVGGIPQDAKEEDLRLAFEIFGPIKASCAIIQINVNMMCVLQEVDIKCRGGLVALPIDSSR